MRNAQQVGDSRATIKEEDDVCGGQQKRSQTLALKSGCSRYNHEQWELQPITGTHGLLAFSFDVPACAYPLTAEFKGRDHTYSVVSAMLQYS